MSAPRMPQTTTTFADFPREIRDMVFLNIASAAEVFVDEHDSHNLRLAQYSWDDIGYAPCITLLHEWAPKSYIAKAACETIWSYGTFHHGWCSKSEAIVDPQEMIYIETLREGRKPVGTPIDLRECVQNLHLYTNADPLSFAKPRDVDTQSLLKLKRELAQLHAFPHLRHVELEIYVHRDCDAYFEGMIVVESILEPCKELRARIGSGLKIMLCRAPPFDDDRFEYLEEMDISWMWRAPSWQDRECVKHKRGTIEQNLRVLIADGVGPEAEYTMLEELHFASDPLPQEAWAIGDIGDMEARGPWTGISEEKFKDLKEFWGTDDEGVPGPRLQTAHLWM